MQELASHGLTDPVECIFLDRPQSNGNGVTRASRGCDAGPITLTEMNFSRGTRQ